MKPGCDTLRRRIILLDPGTPLDPDLSEHLASCKGCSDALRSNQALWSLLGEYQAPPLNIDLFGRIEQQLERNRRPPLRARLAAWIEALAPHPQVAGMALVALGIIIGAWMGTTLATTANAQTSALATAQESESYAPIFEPSPPGFLDTTDPWDVQEGKIP